MHNVKKYQVYSENRAMILFRTSTKKLVDQLGLIATWILATKSQYNFMKSEYHIDRNINVPL